MSIVSHARQATLTLVVVRLHGRHFHAQDLFALGGEFLDDILLQPPQHERGELLMEVLDLGLLIGIVEIEIVGEVDLSEPGQVRGSLHLSGMQKCIKARSSTISAATRRGLTLHVVLKRCPCD
jgi:hypothetical protein